MTPTGYRRIQPSLIGCLVLLCLGSLPMIGCEEDEPEVLFGESYSDWESTVSEPLTYAVPGHGERLRMIYINDVGTEVKRRTDEEGRTRYDFPAGTIIVKENYTDVEGSALANLTIMIKAPADDRAQAGWIWLSKDPETGEERVFSESDFCITCHAGANRSHPYGDENPRGEFRDYVFFPPPVGPE